MKANSISWNLTTGLKLIHYLGHHFNFFVIFRLINISYVLHGNILWRIWQQFQNIKENTSAEKFAQPVVTFSVFWTTNYRQNKVTGGNDGRKILEFQIRCSQWRYLQKKCVKKTTEFRWMKNPNILTQHPIARLSLWFLFFILFYLGGQIEPHITHLSNLVFNNNWQLIWQTNRDCIGQGCCLCKRVHVTQCKCQWHRLVHLNHSSFFRLRDQPRNNYVKMSTTKE